MKHEDPKSLTITLPADQIERLEEAVASGEYASKDEIVRYALRAWENSKSNEVFDEDHLKREYDAGLASGEPVAVDILTMLADLKVAKHARS
jgi:antitoxin ParD1/3/4